MAWMVLVAAGLLEVIWSLALKRSEGLSRPLWAVTGLGLAGDGLVAWSEAEIGIREAYYVVALDGEEIAEVDQDLRGGRQFGPAQLCELARRGKRPGLEQVLGIRCDGRTPEEEVLAVDPHRMRPGARQFERTHPVGRDAVVGAGVEIFRAVIPPIRAGRPTRANSVKQLAAVRDPFERARYVHRTAHRGLLRIRVIHDIQVPALHPDPIRRIVGLACARGVIADDDRRRFHEGLMAQINQTVDRIGRAEVPPLVGGQVQVRNKLRRRGIEHHLPQRRQRPLVPEHGGQALHGQGDLLVRVAREIVVDRRPARGRGRGGTCGA